MSNPVISVEHLSKAYRLGQIGTGTLTYDLQLWWAKLLGKPNPLLRIGETDHGNREGETIWALNDVSFTVDQGEVLGIIGRNGAGKSTLLKILSRVTAPTSGRIRVKGRVASLLEVGTGFHPELTGRENIYLNGAILGMSKQEVTRKFDEIVNFAEIEKFIDTPVKRYSSGMYVRLAFAVAAHLDPEILIVDEVLAVGDAAFQKKCLGKMGDVAKKGRTVLFVSHNMTAIKSLCPEVMLIRSGLISSIGEATEIVNQYQSLDQQAVLERVWECMDLAPGNDAVRVKSVKILPQIENRDGLISVKTPLDLHFEFWNLKHAAINLSLHLETLSGEVLFAVASPQIDLAKEIAKITCHFPGDLLNDGTYTVRIMIVKDSAALFVLKDAVIFEVHDVERAGNWWGKWPGAVRPKLSWQHSVKEYNGDELS